MSRQIVGIIYKFDGLTPWAGARLAFSLLTDTAARADAAWPVWSKTVTAGDDGAIPAETKLDTPPSGSWKYRLKIEENTPLDFYLEQGDGSDLSISDIVALAGVAGSEAGTPQGEFLNGLYALVAGAADGRLLETAGGGLAVSDAEAANVPTSAEAAWLTAGKAAVADASDLVDANDLGSAAYAATDDFDAAGSAASVASDLGDHENETGAGVHGAGATGAALLAAATQDAARAVLGLAAVALPPRHIDHMRLTFGAVDVVGSGALVTFAGGQWQLATGTTANSTYRYRVSDNTICLNYTDEGVSWNRKLEFFGHLRNSEANAEGVFRAFFGKQTTGAFGVANSEYYVALEVLAGVLTNAYVCNGSTAVTVPLTPTALPTSFFISANNGTVSFYANGVLIGTTASGPNATNRPASISYEINNGATAANYKIRIWSQSQGY